MVHDRIDAVDRQLHAALMGLAAGNANPSKVG
jgi:hypothetical protein